MANVVIPIKSPNQFIWHGSGASCSCVETSGCVTRVPPHEQIIVRVIHMTKRFVSYLVQVLVIITVLLIT